MLFLQDCCKGKSMLQKSRDRSRTKKYLHRNLTAGHVTPDEHYLGRAGLRGRKMVLCVCLMMLLLFIALGHLAVTCLILGVLRFGTSGFAYFAFSGSSTIWPQGGSLSNVTIGTPNGINGFSDSPLSLLAAQEEEIRYSVKSQGELVSALSLLESAVNLSVGECLNVSGSNGEQLLFGNSSLLQVRELSVLGGVKTPQITTPSVNGVNRISSSRHLTLRGEGGVTARGCVVNVTAGGRVSLAGQRVVLDGAQGVVLQGLPAGTPGTPGTPGSKHHLCALRNGTLFLVPANPLRCLGRS